MVLSGKVERNECPDDLTMSEEELEDGTAWLCTTYPRGPLYVLTYGLEHVAAMDRQISGQY